jgi:hypothetical protein
VIAGALQIVVMKCEKNSIAGGVHVGFEICITQVDCHLESRHRIFWGIAGATAVCKGVRGAP